MEKLGTSKRPAIARVQDFGRAQDIMDICAQNGWQVIVGIEPDKFEDISDVKKLLKPPKPVLTTKAKIGRNAPCSCGSGKKYKKCCFPT